MMTAQMPCRLQRIGYSRSGVPLLDGVVMPGTPRWQTDPARPQKHSPFLDAGALAADPGSHSGFLARLAGQNLELDSGFRLNSRRIEELINPLLVDSASVPTPSEPQIIVLRAQGNKVPKKPLWKTGDAASSEPDVLRAVNAIREGVLFFQALADSNIVVKKYVPDFRFDVRPFVIVLDYNPKGDGQGYTNASHGMSEQGAHIIIIGETPPEGSPDHEFFNPVLDDLMIIFHELAHGFVSALMAYAGRDLEYIFLTGGFNESVGDCLGAMGATQFITANGGVFKGLDQPGRLFKSAEDYILGRAWLRDGRYLRNVLEPGKPGRPADSPLGRDLQRGNKAEYLEALKNGSMWMRVNRDRGGVHIFSSFDNSRRGTEVFTGGGNWLNPLQDLVGGLVFTALLGKDQTTPPEATLLEMAAAYMAKPDPQILSGKAAAAELTGFFNDIKMPDEAAVRKFLMSFDAAYTKAKKTFLAKILSGEFDPRVRRAPFRQIPA